MTMTHRLKWNDVYYKVGPQQGAPPDGVISQGTRCKLLGGSIGSYVNIETEDGRVGYVSGDSLEKVAADTANEIITYHIFADHNDGLRKAAKTACNFWNRFVRPGRHIVIQLSVFTSSGNTIARAYQPFVEDGVMYGKVEFNTKYMDQFTSNGIAGTIVHEIGHTLGMGWDQWMTLFDPATGAFTAAAVAALPALAEMAAETDYGPGTRYSHWDEERFPSDLMSGFKSQFETVLPVTIEVMGLLGNEVIETLAVETDLEQLLQETAGVLFSRAFDTQSIKLDRVKEMPLWEELFVSADASAPPS